MKTFARHIGHIRINGQTTIHNLKIGKTSVYWRVCMDYGKSYVYHVALDKFFLTLQNKKYAAFFKTKDENPSLFLIVYKIG